MKNDTKPNVTASYVGLAIGDALGATTEFMTPREIQASYGVHNRIIGGGWLHLRPGRVTDDTEMSLALGKSIIDSGGFCLSSVGDHFVTWMRSKPVDIGSTVRKGIRDYMLNGTTISDESEMSAGNGAAMRNLPVIIYCLKKWDYFEDMTLHQSHLTHNNAKSDLITLCFGEMVKVLLDTGDKLKALNIANKLIKIHPKFSYSRYKGESSGYIVDTFKTVLHHFADSSDFEETLLRVVNQGGDADTNGAIAGMLAGALYGMDSIPGKWLRKVDQNVISDIKIQTKKLLELPVRYSDEV
ncbi:ADP-ribosyl-(dinitrogen reductase) hydrolase [Denitrovibrio acetiphilus DSM 12809]|uniref:ADP-ribosyl-(Dinitrogen reductase) hydrolase n=1 Tax=Denitrovibrio acetiphilus (strain DSM 12809 / NBRC 114555 / N2460) TaxID=522772 RepID=D4H6V3_DENA2|nr:ADP-ribosyl-[dinitrogen reductase] hydrolase [Denitrovibrio acetiphilus]ADD67819.1 ADP-ribosyl-(dinitrogen reductase) hydrolase [Denitrovibrio acetiphilus DSM 12809]